jgi:hypothetical protein
MNMKSKLRPLAAASMAYALLSSVVSAANVSLGGTPLTSGPVPLYGDQIYQNNVVNSPGAPATGSVLNDPTGPYLTAATPWVKNGQVTTSFPFFYAVDWFFVGAESGLVNTFTAPSLFKGPVTFTENNQNNSAYAGGPPAIGPVIFIGTTYANTAAAIQFSISWAATADNPGGSVNNSAPQASPGSGSANMIFAFLDMSGSCVAANAGCNITSDPNKSSDWFVFALNDSGGADDNHDDYIGLGRVYFVPDLGGGFPTPLPAALPLFVTGLGALGLLGWRRKRKG